MKLAPGGDDEDFCYSVVPCKQVDFNRSGVGWSFVLAPKGKFVNIMKGITANKEFTSA